MIIKINPENPQKRLIEQVVEILKEGGLIAYPTDTQYGIGCDLSKKRSVEKIYQLKKRDFRTPFSFICSDLKDIAQYAKVSNSAYKTMRRLFPGPYTFILAGSRLVPKLMMTKRHECGIRVPNHNIPLKIIRNLGNPIINTSASLDEQEAPVNAYEIEEMFKGQLDLIIDGGPVPGQPSTVVSLIEDTPTVIRQGLGEWL